MKVPKIVIAIMKARRFQKSGVRYSDIERDAILVPFCRAQETRAIVNKSSPRNYIHLIITELVNSGNFISSRMQGNKEIGPKRGIFGWPDSPIGKRTVAKCAIISSQSLCVSIFD